MDIRCVRLQPYNIDGKVLLDIQQVLPLPEAADYQVKVRRKEAAIERARTDGRDFTRYSIVRGDAVGPELNKRYAVLEMVEALYEGGVPVRAIKEVLPSARMLAIAGEFTDGDEGAAATPRGRPSGARTGVQETSAVETLPTMTKTRRSAPQVPCAA